MTSFHSWFDIPIWIYFWTSFQNHTKWAIHFYRFAINWCSYPPVQLKNGKEFLKKMKRGNFVKKLDFFFNRTKILKCKKYTKLCKFIIYAILVFRRICFYFLEKEFSSIFVIRQNICKKFVLQMGCCFQYVV